MLLRSVGLWAAILLGCGLLQQGCQTTERGVPDVVPPHTTAMPAGGVYRALPEQTRLLTDEKATIYYRWNESLKQRYTAPIRFPASATRHMTLHFWAQDAAGNREPLRREHYVLAPAAPHVELLGSDRTVLGVGDAVTLRWQSTAPTATYEFAVTSSGWEPGRRLLQGAVTPNLEYRTSIAATSLRPGENRLWLRVRNAAGVVASTSLLLTVHATPAMTYAWPASGVFGRPQTVTLFSDRPTTIYYTTDGSVPTPDSSRYTEPLTITRHTRLRFISVDDYGNREAPRQEDYEIQAAAPTIALQTFEGYQTGGAESVAFTWQSDTAGHYEVRLIHLREHRQVTLQQGTAPRQHVVRSVMTRNFLTAGEWRVQVQLESQQGRTGRVSFRLRVPYLETFADTRYHDPQTTTAAWEPVQRHVRLTRGPRLVGTYATRGRSRQARQHGSHVYVANGKGGLHIVDVSDPHQPRRTGVFYPHGKAVSLAKHGPYVYMAASGSGLSIFDVRQPAVPRLVATVPVPGGAADIVIVAPYAYVGTPRGVLYIFDLTTPQQPRLLGQTAVGGQVADIAVSAGMVYLACLSQGLAIVDAKVPQQPRLVQRWPTSAAATGVAIHGQYAYVAAGGLEVIEVRHPEAPVRRERRHLPGAYGVALLPPYVLVASGTDGVHVLSMQQRRALHRSPTAHYAARLALTKRHALVADTQGGLRILDVSQPAQPRMLAALDDIGTIVDVVVDGSLAYLANDRHGSGLVVVDIRDPAAPRVIGQYHTALTTDVVVWKDFAVLSDAAGLLHVVDVQRPTRPRLLGSLAVSGTPQRLALLPPYVLVASDTAGVHVVDMAQPHRPQLRATVPLPGRALDIALVEHTAYVAAVEGGIQTVDLSTPEHPTLGMPYQHPDGEGDRVIRLVAHAQHIYAFDSQRGVQILTRSASGRIEWQGGMQVPQGAPWALTAVGPYLFVTTLLNSLYVMDVTTPSQPRLLSTAPYGGAGVYAVGRYLYIAVRGQRGQPGGLRVVETFAAVSQAATQEIQARGVHMLPGATPQTFMVNRAYTFNTPGVVQSTVLSPPDIPVSSALLQVQDFWGRSGRIRYELSNDGGEHWYHVEPGERLHFARPGTELRWRATLTSTDLATTPILDMMTIDYTTSARVSP